MIAWMLYAVLVAVLLTLGAHAADRVLRLHGRPTRWVWMLSLLLSLAVSALWPRLPRTPDEAPAALVPPSFSLQLDAITTAPITPAVWPLSRVLLLGWLALSAALVLYGVFAFWRLRRARVSWQAGQLDGQSVLVSRDVGPAVIGLVRPTVVVPEWVCTLPARDQRLILAHENAHIGARDQWLVVCSYLLPVIMPWNAAAWLQAKRLRESVELDCDARLLAGPVNPHGYAELLLNVGGRSTRAPLAVAALSEPRSLLEKRIRRMFERRPRHRVLRASAWASLAALAVLATLRAPLPGAPFSSGNTIDESAAAQLVSLVADTSPPRLLNPAEVRDAVRVNYPASLRESGVGGITRLWLQITDDGEVAAARVSRSSRNTALDEAALKVAGIMRFAPAQFQGKPVPATTELNVEFTLAGETGALAATRPARAETRAEVATLEARSAAAAVAAPGSVPTLLNVAEISELQSRAYPAELSQAGLGGRVTIWYYVDETGKVTKTQTRSSSGIRVLDEAAMSFADKMVFKPAQKDGRPVAAWVEVPIDFVPNAAAVATTRPTARAQAAAGPTFTPYTVKPSLKNAEVVSRALQNYYPPLLRDAGIGGTASIWFYIDENGRVAKTQLKNSTGHAALDDAALKVAEMMEFTSALNRDQRVAVWVDMPIVFRPSGGSQEQAYREVELAKAAAVERAAASPRAADRTFVPGSTVLANEPIVVTGTATRSGVVASAAAANAGWTGYAPLSATSGKDTVRTTAAARTTPRAVTTDTARALTRVAATEQSLATRLLANSEEIGRALQRYYPPLLRDAGVGGTAKYNVVVAPDGSVLKMELRESSGHQALDSAALRVLELARFRPTGQTGPITIDVPITFRVQ